MTELKYLHNPIYNVESLAKLLGTTPSKLKQLSENSHKYYRMRTKPKINGGVRKYYSIKEPLKSVLRKIRTRILIKVTYPDYLQGSIKRRSQKTNARIHVGAKCLIALDIADFFPSITGNHVNRIFRYFFNFSEDVSTLLTGLIIYRDKLPQGSPVSSDIANLALCWDGKEGVLIENLAKRGLRTSRYVDDIAISATRPLKNGEKTEIIKMWNSFLKSKGFKISHKKTSVAGPNKRKCVTGLRIGKDRVNITDEYVDSAYRQIKQLGNKKSPAARKISSIRGKLNHIRQFDPKHAKRLEQAGSNVINY